MMVILLSDLTASLPDSYRGENRVMGQPLLGALQLGNHWVPLQLPYYHHFGVILVYQALFRRDVVHLWY